MFRTHPTSDLPAFHARIAESDGDVAPIHGLVNAVLLSVPLWAMIGLAVWAMA